VAFIDVRMPPGIDGIETTARLWESARVTESSLYPLTSIIPGRR